MFLYFGFEIFRYNGVHCSKFKMTDMLDLIFSLSSVFSLLLVAS